MSLYPQERDADMKLIWFESSPWGEPTPLLTEFDILVLDLRLVDSFRSFECKHLKVGFYEIVHPWDELHPDVGGTAVSCHHSIPVAAVVQVWSLTQFYSVDFSQSRIGVKKCAFNKRTIKVCVSCLWQCRGTSMLRGMEVNNWRKP